MSNAPGVSSRAAAAATSPVRASLASIPWVTDPVSVPDPPAQPLSRLIAAPIGITHVAVDTQEIVSDTALRVNHKPP